jgi:hypothetical protein
MSDCSDSFENDAPVIIDSTGDLNVSLRSLSDQLPSSVAVPALEPIPVSVLTQNKDLLTLVPVSPLQSIMYLPQCVNNNISKTAFTQRRHLVKKLEMCYYNYPRISWLDYFPNITHLTLVAQDIDIIQNLSGCPNLTHLWVCETKVTAITGLEGCQKLINLFLYVHRSMVLIAEVSQSYPGNQRPRVA